VNENIITKLSTDPQAHATNNSSIAERIHCRGNVFIDPLPSSERRDKHTDTQTDGRDL
jgi:hypothetical protein